MGKMGRGDFASFVSKANVFINERSECLHFFIHFQPVFSFLTAFLSCDRVSFSGESYV